MSDRMKSDWVSVGVDASLTGLAVCVADPDQVHLQVEFSSAPCHGVRERFRRYQGLTRQVRAALSPYRGRIHWIGIEGYAFASKTSGTTLGEFGGQLRVELLEFGPLVEVVPSTLKLFATGNGKAEKIEVASELTKRYGVAFKTDNQADAFGVVRVVMCAADLAEPANAAQRRAVVIVREAMELERAA